LRRIHDKRSLAHQPFGPWQHFRKIDTPRGHMIGNVMMRVSALILLVGMIIGIAMGVAQNFTLASAHAHLNLIGGVLLFLCGFYYRENPIIGSSRLAVVQGVLHIVAAVVFPAGIGAVMLYGTAYEILPIIGSFMVVGTIALFAFLVFKSTQTIT
jgi:hypothetical protein